MALRARLEERRAEIEDAALTRVRAIADPVEVSDPAYAEGLRAAISAAVAYGIETTGREAGDPPIPVALLAQARMAARVGIPLDTVLRRYFAGYSLLSHFILEEATNAGLSDGAELKRLLGAHAGIFDRLLAAIGEEHARESEALRSSSHSMQSERIDRLLSGEQVDTSDMPYDFDGFHLGMMVKGPDARAAVHSFARDFECSPLSLCREDETVSAWLGGYHPLDPEAVRASASACGSSNRVTLGMGEPQRGLPGWRLTHQQANVALLVAERISPSIVRYGEVALLAAVLRDDLLAASLRKSYLDPLSEERDGGHASRQTLRAYFAAGFKMSPAAAALGVSRNTIASRLRTIENLLDRSLVSCAGELQVALQWDEFNSKVGTRAHTAQFAKSRAN